MTICMTLLSFQGQIGIEMGNFGGKVYMIFPYHGLLFAYSLQC